MSGETERDVSGWTVDTLHLHLMRQIEDLRRANDDRDRLLTQIMDERRDAAERQFHRYSTTVEAAIAKAEQATERRFEAVNEFRAQLGDQARQFLPRNEYLTAHSALEERVTELTDRMNRQQGQSNGIRMTGGVIAAVIAAAASLMVTVSAVVVLVAR